MGRRYGRMCLQSKTWTVHSRVYRHRVLQSNVLTRFHFPASFDFYDCVTLLYRSKVKFRFFVLSLELGKSKITTGCQRIFILKNFSKVPRKLEIFRKIGRITGLVGSPFKGRPLRRVGTCPQLNSPGAADQIGI